MPPYFDWVGTHGLGSVVGTSVQAPSRCVGSPPLAVVELVEELPLTMGTILEEVSSPQAAVESIQELPPSKAAVAEPVQGLPQSERDASSNALLISDLTMHG